MPPPESVISPRLWIVARNDAEAVEIHKLLQESGELVETTSQAWGASWQKLEPGISSRIQEFLTTHPGGEVVGVELAGRAPDGARNIDHHRYRDEDRSRPLASLEQIADLLAVPLSRFRKLVAANDRGYIAAMRAAGALPDEIEAIRAYDRRCQGVTPRQEAFARRDVAAAEWNDRRALVRCPDGVTSAQSDLLFECADEVLLLSPQECDYYGPRHRNFAAMKLPEPVQWCGGNPDKGFFGIANPSPQTIELLVANFWRIHG